MKQVNLEWVGQVEYIWQMNTICDTCGAHFKQEEQTICVVKKVMSQLVGVLLCVGCSTHFKIGDTVQ